MKTTFDLPDPLMRQAKAAAADQGRSLRDLVAEAIKDKLSAIAAARSIRRKRSSEWEEFSAKLQRQPDGSFVNPDVPEDEDFSALLERIRAERAGYVPRNPFEGFDFGDEGLEPTPPPSKGDR